MVRSDLLESVVSFSKCHDIDILDLQAQYVQGRGRCRQEQITVEHHFRFDIFNATIDAQLQELNHKFNDDSMEILKLCGVLNLKNYYKSFDIKGCCKLAKTYNSLSDKLFVQSEMVGIRLLLIALPMP
ncbi:uncharacterized protein [Rutidosis leptorrhynchoides]|uniref:uncharacterized protein n=1 Tax=Rutidosis leptorrhynchoides TaxID=125765 RepID=UPI003A99D60D